MRQNGSTSQILAAVASKIARTAMPSADPSTLYELMFDPRDKITGRLTDAVDLLIDFATLGEYGLEPVGRTSPSCETRRRKGTPARSNLRRREADRSLALRP
jgi:hypothetical protein